MSRRNTFWPQKYYPNIPPQLENIRIGSCTYDFGDLIKMTESLGIPCNDTCNLPIPAQTYGISHGYTLAENFKLSDAIKTFLSMGEFIHAKVKLTSEEKEIACVEGKIDYSLE